MRNIDFIQMMEAVRDQTRVVDLSYTMEEGMPAWPTQARYGTTVYESYDFGDPAIHSAVYLSEHTGTHIDAPKHFIPGGCPVDELDPKTVMGRGVVIHGENVEPGGTISLDRILEFEKENGEIRPRDIVMIRFGWDEKYSLQPGAQDYLKDWPGLGSEAAAYFVKKKVGAVGCDTLALDAFGEKENVCHHILLGNGIPIIENIWNLSMLPVHTYVIGLPNKFKGGSGSPIRLVAFVQ